MPKPEVYLPSPAEIRAACLEIRSGKRTLKNETRRSDKREAFLSLQRAAALAAAESAVRLTGQARADLLAEASAQFESERQRAQTESDRARNGYRKSFNVDG